MKYKKNLLIQMISQNDAPYKCEAGLFYEKLGDEWKLINQKQLNQSLLRVLDNPSTNAMKEIAELLRLNDTSAGMDVWDVWRNARNKEYADIQADKPLLVKLFDDVLNIHEYQRLWTLLASIVQGKNGLTVLLHGVPNAGKSLIIDCMIDLFKGFEKPLHINDFNNQFGLDGIEGKLLLQANDLGAERITPLASGRFKELCDGRNINVQRKGKVEQIVDFRGNLIFGCNVLPEINVLDGGVMARFAYMNFTKAMTIKGNYYAIKQQLSSPQELCNLYTFLIDFDVKDAVIDDAVEQFKAAQLKRLLHLIPTENTDYAKFCELCMNAGYNKKYDVFEFTAIKGLLYNDLDPKVEQYALDTDLPF